MTQNAFLRGSEWRKWDFAVKAPHLPKGDKGYAAFAQAINTSAAEVAAILESYSVNGFREISASKKCTKPLFPIVALKSFVTHQGKSFPFRILFDSAPDLLKNIEQFLAELPCQTSDGQRALLKDIDEQTRYEGNIFVDFIEVDTRLKNDSHLRDNHLIILPYADRNIAPAEDNIFREKIIDRIDLIDSHSLEHQDFFQWKSAKHAPEVIRLWLNLRKLPCVSGSEKDAKDPTFGKLKTAQNPSAENYCWVKANPTFDGLKQVLADPDRVFFGKEPAIFQSTKRNGNRYIRSLTLSKTPESAVREAWFDGLKIEFGSELIAIIGNKGSGKSALVDILALLGNSQVGNFSFLTKDKFRKKNLAGNFSAALTWADNSTSDSKTLDLDPDSQKPEHIKYIPQNHFERLCTLGGEEFEDELQSVIFHHLEPAKRLGCHSFRELIVKKRALADDNIAARQAQLQVLNKHIIVLEEKRTEVYRNKTQHLLDKKQKERAEHEAKKPNEIANPSVSKDIQHSFEEINSAIADLRKELAQTEVLIVKKQDEQMLLEEQHAQLQAFVAKWQRVKEGIDTWQRQDKGLLKDTFGIKIENVIDFTLKTEIIEKKIAVIQKSLTEITVLLGKTEDNSDNKPHPQSLVTLCQDLQNQIETQIALLDLPHQQYQSYLTELKIWEDQRKQIIGDSKTDDTIAFYESILDYLDNRLDAELKQKFAERKTVMEAILQQKREILALFSNLKAPVSTFLSKHADLIKEYNISLEVSLRMLDFEKNFAAFINTESSGAFAENPLLAISKLLAEVEPEESTAIADMLEKIIDTLQFDRRQKKAIKKFIHTQVKKGKILELYNYLFGLEYLVPEYELRLDGKSISELSPGERGSLLLVFYLMIDKDETPLILDQPEDNLDNQSISKILVPFLRRAKGRRQVIMVTHNPNLAVLADAEQIIRVRIHKDKDHQVEAVSGALEDPIMNRHVLDVLEGTEQAFSMRGRKYKFSGK